MKPAIAASYSDTVQTFCQSACKGDRAKTMYAQTLNRFKPYTLLCYVRRCNHNLGQVAEIVKQPKDVAGNQPDLPKKNLSFHFDQLFLSIIQK